MKGKFVMWTMAVMMGIWGCGGNTADSHSDSGPSMDDISVKISGVYADTLTGDIDNQRVVMEVTLNADSTFSLTRYTITSSEGQPVPVKGPRQVLSGIFLPRDNWKKIKLTSKDDGGHATCFEILPDAIKLLNEDESPIAKPGNFTLKRAAKAVMNVGQYMLSYDQKPFSHYPVQVFLRTSGNHIRIHKAYLDVAKEYERAILAYYGLKYNPGCDEAGCSMDMALGLNQDQMKSLVQNQMSDMNEFLNGVSEPVNRQRLSMILINKSPRGYQVHVGYIDASDHNYTSVDEFALEGEKLRLTTSTGDKRADK